MEHISKPLGEIVVALTRFPVARAMLQTRAKELRLKLQAADLDIVARRKRAVEARTALDSAVHERERLRSRLAEVLRELDGLR